jgi:hypothetical protein
MPLSLIESFGLVALALLGLILLAVIGARLGALRNRLGALSRIEAKLDLLLKQANIRFEGQVNVRREVADALRAGRKIEAIKLYREATGVGLKEAKDYVEEVERQGGTGWS